MPNGLTAMSQSDSEFINSLSQELAQSIIPGQVSSFKPDLIRQLQQSTSTDTPEARVVQNVSEGLLGLLEKSQKSEELKVEAPFGAITGGDIPRVDSARQFLVDLMESEDFRALGPASKRQTFGLALELSKQLSESDKTTAGLLKEVLGAPFKFEAAKAGAGAGAKNRISEKLTAEMRASKDAVDGFAPFVDTIRLVNAMRNAPAGSRNRQVGDAIASAMDSDTGSKLWRGLTAASSEFFGQNENLTLDTKQKIQTAIENDDQNGFYEALQGGGFFGADSLTTLQKSLEKVLSAESGFDFDPGKDPDLLSTAFTDQIIRTLKDLAFRRARAVNGARVSDADFNIAEIITSLNAGDFKTMATQSENILSTLIPSVVDNLDLARTFQEQGRTGAEPIIERLENSISKARTPFSHLPKNLRELTEGILK